MAIYFFDIVCLWLEKKGWLYYRNKKAESGIIGKALLEMTVSETNTALPKVQNNSRIKMVIIRKAKTSDANAIARVHIASWQVVYRGHVPDEVLNNLSLNEREQMWHELLEKNVNVLVVLKDNNLVGFISFGPSRDTHDDPLHVAEITALYIMPNEWRNGFGKTLLTTAISSITKNNFRTVILWVVDSNQQAKNFYEINGFKNSHEMKVEKREKYSVRQAKYIFEIVRS